MSMKFANFAAALIISLIVHASAHATDPACEEGTPKGFEKCADNAFREADKELNTVYRELINNIPEKPLLGSEITKADLVAAQRAWLKYIELSCEIQGALTRAPTEWTNRTVDWCKAHKTQRRTEELRLWLGCIKGDEGEHGPVCGAL